MTSLPEPASERWQPLRAGLVDLFYYDIEEFHFHHGSLLLRGNNGTGKSKVLALTLPFLLDGELAAHRVEPDGDKQKKMEWNLLLGGRHPHHERLGYTWLEFGRRDSDGATFFTTVGCGLKAVKDRGIARHWFFVTSQRIGPDFSLVTPSRTALPRERLKEALAGHGNVYDTASEYRRAVDQAMFGLGTRYEALVSLLIQLRQPQLSKRPDERLLSHALTSALPPLDDNLLIQVAEAFRSLDDERTTLEGMQEAKKTADDFLNSYRRYAGVAAKRKATAVRTAQSRYEQLGRDQAEQERASQAAEAVLIAAENLLNELGEQRNVLRARRQALEDSPEMRAAKDLEQADDYAVRLERIATQQKHLLDEAIGKEQEARRRAQQAQRETEKAQAQQQSTTDNAESAANDARLGSNHTQQVAAAIAVEEPPYPQARQHAEEIIQWRSQSLSNLERLLGEANTAKQNVADERRELDRLQGEVSVADERIAAAEETAVTAGEHLVTSTRHHLEQAVHLRLPELDTTIAQLELWAETLDGPNPAHAAVRAAAQEATLALARREAQLTAELNITRTGLGELRQEQEHLIAGGHEMPPAPHTRSANARSGPGAPLWKVIDFTHSVSTKDRAGLEAALEAAGILDGWVQPDGTLLADGTDDIVVTGGPVVPQNLTRVLQPVAGPAKDAGLAPEAVHTLLAAIGLGGQSDAMAWVDVNGRFGNGVLTGQWHKHAAVHIGEGAREAARQARLAELTVLIEQATAQIGDLTDRLAETEQQRMMLMAEADSVPGDHALREAFTLIRTERDSRRRLADAYHQSQEKLRNLEAQALLAQQRSVEFASDVGLPLNTGELKQIRDALGEYRVALAEWWPACLAAAEAAVRLATAQDDYTDASAKVEPAKQASDGAATEAQAARERYSALLDASGASIAELQRQLGSLRTEQSRVDREEKAGREREREALGAKGRADGKLEELMVEIEHAAAQRDADVEHLRQFATTGLLELACPQLETPSLEQTPWPATPAVLIARAIDRELSEVDDADRRWELVQQHVSNDSKTLTDGLSRHGHRAAVMQRGDVLVVDVTFQGRIVPVAVLADALAAEVQERQRLLSAREREVLENHLVSEVAGALQELITIAERQVETMNQELEQRPTSTGMQLRLVWRTAKDAPVGLAELRDRQLRQTTDVWNEEDRRVVGAFLQQQIATERLRDSSGTWIEQLTRALDYRSWHEFAIQRRQDGQWRPATGPASGGERVLAASIPLFAAAASYYSSAHQHAPQLIALDEAFAGVDDDSRAKCLGLLATFDLDVVMTSEREWGCYPQVPGLAIAQLSRRDGVDAVLVTPWRWDGHGHRYQVPRPVPHIPAQPASKPLEQAAFDI